MNGSLSKKQGWSRVKFGDVVRQVKDKVDPKSSGLERYIAGEHMDTDDLRIRQWGDISENYLGPAFHMRFNPGQVLYGSRRTYLRKVAVPDFEGICANTTYVLESKDPSALLPELLPFIMQMEAFHEHSIKQSKGSVNPYINFSDIAWYEFALPPLEEQRRILQLLVAIQYVVDAAYQELEHAGIVSRAGLNKVIVGGIPDSDLTDVRIVTDVSLPSGWCFREAQEICKVLVTSGSTPRKGIVDTDTGMPFIRVQNLAFDGSLEFDPSPKYLEDRAFKNTVNQHVISGDVLTNIVGPPLGKVSIVPEHFPESQINQAVVRFRPQNKYARSIITGYLISDWCKQWLFSRSKKTSGQRNINSTTCAKLPIPIPPENEQKELAFEIETLMKLPQTANERLENSKSFMKHTVNIILREN